MGYDGNTRLGIPDDDGVQCDARHQDPVPVGRDSDGGGGAGLGEPELAGPTHWVIHPGLTSSDGPH